MSDLGLSSVRLERCEDRERFLRDPVGRYFVTPISLAWCESERLCGNFSWGSPTPAQAHDALAVLAAVDRLPPGFSVVMDASRVDSLSLESLRLVLAAARERRDLLRQRVTLRVGVVRDNALGLTLAGISPLIGRMGRVRVVTDSHQAFRLAAPERADELWPQLRVLLERAQGEQPALVALRLRLTETRGHLTINQAAERLCTSRRVLQRQLSAAGTSFRAEVEDARWLIVQELMQQPNAKIVAVATELGLSETGLADLIRRRARVTPTVYRAQLLRAQLVQSA